MYKYINTVQRYGTAIQHRKYLLGPLRQCEENPLKSAVLIRQFCLGAPGRMSAVNSTSYGMGQGWSERMWDCAPPTTMTIVMTCRLAEHVGCLARLKRPCQPSGFKTGASTADGGIGTAVKSDEAPRRRDKTRATGMDRSTGREGHLRMILKYANIPRHRPPPLLRCPRPRLRAV